MQDGDQNVFALDSRLLPLEKVPLERGAPDRVKSPTLSRDEALDRADRAFMRKVNVMIGIGVAMAVFAVAMMFSIIFLLGNFK